MLTKATYRFIDFVRPGGWPYPYTLEQAFGVYRWMIDSIDHDRDSDRGPWGRSTVHCLISGKPGLVGMYAVDPVTSLDDLRRRFQYAVLHDSRGNVEQWRRRNRIAPDGRRVISFPHATPFSDERSEAQIRQAFAALFNWSGRLNAQLNERHNRAREIYGVQMEYHASLPGWRFVLRYGFDGSVWSHTIARQRPKERLIPAMSRAVAWMDEHTHKAA